MAGRSGCCQNLNLTITQKSKQLFLKCIPVEDCRRESNNKKKLPKLIDMSESTRVIDMLIKLPRFYFSSRTFCKLKENVKP